MAVTPPTDLGGNVVSKAVGVAQDSSGDPKIVTAGATEDGVEVTCEPGIDTLSLESGVLAIAWSAILAATKTLSLTLRIQESADNSAWDAATSLATIAVVGTGGGGGTTEIGVTEQDVALKARKRYIRFLITPTMSATGTDTAIWGAAFLANADVLPAT